MECRRCHRPVACRGIACDKFFEQGIMGNVLLELNIGVLKPEISIVAY
jgi:hypothetical protein